MELDEMKQAWQVLDRHLHHQHVLNLQLFRESRVDRLRRGLRPLVWGQALQILMGVLGLLVLAPVWMPLWRDPVVLVAGVTMHLYCIGLIVLGGMVEGRIAQIDHAAPVVELQTRLAALRRTYAVFGALFLGLPWWFLTAPLMVVLTRGRIMYTAPLVIWGQLAVGLVGYAGALWFYRWAHQPQRADLGRRVEQGMAGASIRRAQARLDEIARFERE